MSVRFEVVVVLDHQQIERHGKRLGLTLERAQDVTLADIECTLFDSIRFKDGVGHVGVRLLEAQL